MKGLCPQCCASVKAFLDAVKQRCVLLLTLSLFCPVRQMVFSVSTEGRLDFVQNQLMRTAAMNILHSVLCHESPIHCNVPFATVTCFHLHHNFTKCFGLLLSSPFLSGLYAAIVFISLVKFPAMSLSYSLLNSPFVTELLAGPRTLI